MLLSLFPLHLCSSKLYCWLELLVLLSWVFWWHLGDCSRWPLRPSQPCMSPWTSRTKLWFYRFCYGQKNVHWNSPFVEAQQSDIIKYRSSPTIAPCLSWFEVQSNHSFSLLTETGFNWVVQMLSSFHYMTSIGQMSPVSNTICEKHASNTIPEKLYCWLRVDEKSELFQQKFWILSSRWSWSQTWYVSVVKMLHQVTTGSK